jgi:formylglycine-generating enzyme required for sulfatase activity
MMLLAAPGCQRAEAPKAAAPVAERADQPIGCHPSDASSADAVAPEPTATSGNALTPNAATATTPKRQGAGRPADDMVFIKGGRFLMGTDQGLPLEGPVHEVVVKSFSMDRHEVTVAQFAEFVKATGYKTEAEKFGWSGVFDLKTGEWTKVDGADWRHPEGPSSSAPPDEPVAQVSWNDALAYAQWAKKRLPTEAEFEYAARGGMAGKKYAWGDDLRPQGKYMANWWQGVFPVRDLGEDGYRRRAPVGSFPPNGYGLYDITGNVWEWCADWFDENYYKKSPRVNPRGPATGEHRVIRGGSWLCSENYCTGYRVAARNHTAPDSGLNNLGFRCVRDE